jgi:hypothetical protein
MHIELRETQGGLGFWREGYKGPTGDEMGQFTSNLGLRWTIPVTAGGCQVSREGISKGKYSEGVVARGVRHVQLYVVIRVPVYIGMIEVMKDTSCI